ncbi:MAG TPA: zf-HC2 domain-containing protein, partial [Candidatus Ozemobacteraceae bacterium]|nr:zf-HC2 domain-containing protein [Candidatus Ozemobacteraceae bacterium]
MACNADQLQKYLDSDLDTAELASFQDHLRTCSSCRARVERQQQREKLIRDRVRAGLPLGQLVPQVMPRLTPETAP